MTSSNQDGEQIQPNHTNYRDIIRLLIDCKKKISRLKVIYLFVLFGEALVIENIITNTNCT